MKLLAAVESDSKNQDSVECFQKQPGVLTASLVFGEPIM